MPQVLRPKKATEDLSNTIDTSKMVELPNATTVNIADITSSTNTEVKNVISDVATPSNLSADNIANRNMPPVEVHDQPTKPEISDALQKLLEMKVNKTLANAKASLEEKEPTILNKIGEVVIAKPNLGKEIRVPKPVEIVVPQKTIPVENNSAINPQITDTVIQPSQPNTTPAPPVATINSVSQPNNLQPVTVAAPVTEVVPKKSFLDKLLGF